MHRDSLRFALGLAAAGVVLLLPRAAAAGPRDELLRLVPPDTAVCFVVQGLRDQAKMVGESPFAAWATEAIGAKVAGSAELGAIKQLEKFVPGNTAERSLPGATTIASQEELSDLVVNLQKKGLEEAPAKLMADTFGVRAQDVASRASGDPSAKELIDPEQPYPFAAVDEAVDNEFARTLTDVLSRRLPLLLRGRDQGLGIAPKIAARMAQTTRAFTWIR